MKLSKLFTKKSNTGAAEMPTAFPAVMAVGVLGFLVVGASVLAQTVYVKFWRTGS